MDPDLLQNLGNFVPSHIRMQVEWPTKERVREGSPPPCFPPTHRQPWLARTRLVAFLYKHGLGTPCSRLVNHPTQSPCLCTFPKQSLLQRHVLPNTLPSLPPACRDSHVTDVGENQWVGDRTLVCVGSSPHAAVRVKFNKDVQQDPTV